LLSTIYLNSRRPFAKAMDPMPADSTGRPAMAQSSHNCEDRTRI